jgi:hypothetical protein
MPEISRFYGIQVFVNFDDHLPPHFHATYGDDEVLININTLAIYRGSVPRRALRMIRLWASLHQAELIEEWNLAEAGRPTFKIDPLP